MLPASLSFKEPPCHKRKVKFLCSSLPFPDERLLSDKAVLSTLSQVSVLPFSAFPKRMLGPGFSIVHGIKSHL